LLEQSLQREAAEHETLQDIVPLAFPSGLPAAHVPAPGHVSAGALDAKAEPRNLLYTVELLSRQKCDCLEISHAKSLCEQASNAACVVVPCCRNSCRVSKWDTRGSFGPPWRKGARSAASEGFETEGLLKNVLLSNAT